MNAFSETTINAMVFAKESGSEKLISTIGELKKFHDTLAMNFLTYFNIQKNIQKLTEAIKLAPDTKGEEMSPSTKRATAVAAAERPSGISLSQQLQEQRPPPLVLGGAHDHMLTSHMALATYGTMIGAAAKALDTVITSILETADQFGDELKKTAVQAGGTLSASDK